MKFESDTLLIRAEDDTPARVHLFCNLCYPETYLGMLALCGEELMGVRWPPDTVETDCEACVKEERCKKH